MSSPNPTPFSGIAQVDRLIQSAIEHNLKFPIGVKKWQLLAWAAEALESQRQDPGNFSRTGLREVTKTHFPTANP